MLSAQEIAAVDNGVDLVALIGQTVALSHARGGHYEGLCPFHSERTPSFKVTPAKRIWKCFGCSESGTGAISWLMRIDGIKFLDAYNQLANGDMSAKFRLPENSPLPVPKAKLTAIMPIPADVLKSKPEAHRDLGVPAAEWCYRDAKGEPMFYVSRFNISATGKKEVLPLVYTERGWRWQAPQSPTPLYGLDALAAKPAATVVVVEGEKCRKWAQERLPRAVAVTWMGGTGKVAYADREPLKDRKVTLCPDADHAGFKAMEWLGTQLQADGCEVRWAVNPAGVEKGWDAADSGWDGAALLSWLKSSVPFVDRGENPHPALLPAAKSLLPAVKPADKTTTPAADKSAAGQSDKATPSNVPVLAQQPQTPPPHVSSFTNNPDDPFKHLGYERTDGGDVMFWYYSKTRKMTLSTTPRGMGKSGLLLLGSMAYWESRYPKRGGGFDEGMCMNMLIQEGNSVGMFDRSVLRGRGCWTDGGRVVIHAGSHLVVDGKGHDLEFPSRYVYEHRRPLGLDVKSKPMGNAEAREYLEITKSMNWEKGVMGYLLAGWVVIAPLCGILRWRPHLWMVGPAGVGKSTIFDHLVSKMLGDFKAAGQGMGTTEAGIRQSLASDALPYIADEMDATTLQGQMQLKKILEYFRTMSTSGGPKVIKGSGQGTASGFDGRSCVFLSSISAPLDVRADVSRFYVLSLVRSMADDAADAWKAKLGKIMATLTEDYVGRFQARTIAMIPTIMANAEIFAAAAVAVLKDQRLGDQLGPMLAGAWSLVSNSVITPDAAREWIANHEWESNAATSQDEVQLLESILDTLVRYLDVAGRARENTVGELVRALAYDIKDGDASRSTADAVLRQKGMRVDLDDDAPGGGWLYFAKNGEWFREVLKGRPFDVKILKNLRGAEDGGDRKLSFAGTDKRWVRVPLASCGLVAPVIESLIDDLPF